MKSFEMLKCTRLPDNSVALDVEPSIRCDLPTYMVWRSVAILSVCVYVVGIPLWLAYVMFRLRPPVNADSVLGGWLYVPRTARRAQHVRRLERRSGVISGEAGFVLAQQLIVWSKKYSTLTKPFSDTYYYWAIVIVLRNLIVAIISIVCTTLPLYQACLTLLTLALALLLELSRLPYRSGTGMNELEVSSLSSAIAILFLGILFYAELGDQSSPSVVLTWLTLAFVFIFCSVTVALFVGQLRRSCADMRGRKSELADSKQLLLNNVGKDKVRVKTIDTSDGDTLTGSAERRAARRKLKLASASSSIQLAAIDRRRDTAPAHDTTVDWATDERSFSERIVRAEGKTDDGEVEMTTLHGQGGLEGDERKYDDEVAGVESEGDEADEVQVEGERPIAKRVLITSPFPAPLPILTPLAISEEASVTVKCSVSREHKDDSSVSEAQVWLIDHSRLELPAVLRRRERAEGEAEDVEERVRRVRGLWRHATRLVIEQLRRDNEDALQPIYTIGGAVSRPSDAASSSNVEPHPCCLAGGGRAAAACVPSAQTQEGRPVDPPSPVRFVLPCDRDCAAARVSCSRAAVSAS